MGMAYAYGWGSTAPSGPVNAGGQNTCQDPKPFPNILQETELRICTAAESAAFSTQGGLVEGQLCTVGATSNVYSVHIIIVV